MVHFFCYDNFQDTSEDGEKIQKLQHKITAQKQRMANQLVEWDSIRTQLESQIADQSEK